MSAFNVTAHIKIAADSIETLRRCDVFRLLDSCPAEHLNEVSQHIADNRKDLASEVLDCRFEILEERAGR